MKRPGIFNARKFRQLRNKQRKEQNLSIRKAEFETFEPRLLLSADISPITVDFDNKDNSGISLLLDAPELANETPVILTDVVLDKSDETPDSESSLLFNQLVFLDLDGAQDVVYEGPVTVNDVDVAAFAAPDSLTDQTDDIIDAMLAELDKDFAGFGVQFTTDSPLDGVDFSTIYIGGEGAAFSEYGTFIGLSEQVDEGNLDKTDNAFVFSDNIDAGGLSAASFGGVLADMVAHETGHLLGFEHAHTVHTGEASDVLAEVAFKPNTHVEVAKDLRVDLLQDGKLNIAGQDYDIHPKVLEAIEKYPAYFYGGAVGPDSFPDITFGQAVMHPVDTGTWLTRALDMAWAAQSDAAFSAEERLQILSWTYGFLTHSAADVWSHTLVNEFTEGVFPDFADLFSDDAKLANAVRHYLVEAYIGDATPGSDNNSDRSLLPDGDVSDDASIGMVLNAPHRFIYETFIKSWDGDPSAPHVKGVTDISVDTASNSFIRNQGSFLRDGFQVGMEVQATGFNANNTDTTNPATYYVVTA
ncbi:MAG: LEPR-XLL domain-containing protein, partial [Gammaproteobacteria bacterium]